MSNLYRNKVLFKMLIVVFSLAMILSGCAGQAGAPAEQTGAPSDNGGTTEDPYTSYPEGPITLIVGHRAGGSTDIIARTLQPYLQQELSGTIVVENVEGGGGNAALSRIYKAKPDGYTLQLSPFPSATLGELVKDGDFKTKEFTYLHNVTGGDYNCLIVKYDSPYQDLKSLIEAAKTQNITLAGSGIGTNSHMGMSLLEQAGGVKFEYVSFDSGTEAAVAVAGGHTVCGVGNIVSLKQLQDEKKIRILACFGPERHPNFPDIPTAGEAGYPEVTYDVCVGIVGPPNMPADLAKKISDALGKAVNNPEFIKQAGDLGSNVQPDGPEAFQQNVFKIYDQAYALKDALRAQ